MTPRTPIWCHWRLFTASGVAHAPGTAARPRSSYGRLRNVGTKRAVKAEGSGPSARRKPQRPSHRPGSGRPFVPRGPRRSFWLPGEGVERGGMGEGGGATAGRNCSETLCNPRWLPGSDPANLRTRRLPPLLYVTPSAFRFPLLGRGGTSGFISE